MVQELKVFTFFVSVVGSFVNGPFAQFDLD